jgi:hypothetical protein
MADAGRVARLFSTWLIATDATTTSSTTGKMGAPG